MIYSLVIILCMGLLHHTAEAVLMDKLADIKLCGDTGCSCKYKYWRAAAYAMLSYWNYLVKWTNSKTSSAYFLVFRDPSDALSMATALNDFVAPDCRFINIKRGQMIYVYSKLLPAEGAGVFWSGSVCARNYSPALTHAPNTGTRTHTHALLFF